ncbi:MAG: ubiquitin-conjugating enzyme E2 [Asgard group archaeon]|nr:ubiquitin-conjugating enzyme E2 [Asgard group archaeon]
MSRNNINDLAIAREAQLMFTYTQGFKPIGDKLNKWEGVIAVQTASGERSVKVEILVPLKYPQYPPKVFILEKNIQHPNIEKDGNTLLQITHNWKPDTHVYQVVHSLQALFKKVPPQFLDKGAPKATKQKAKVQTSTVGVKQKEVADVNKTITNLQDKIKDRDDELRRLRAQLVKGTNQNVTTIENIEMVLPKDKDRSQELLLQAKTVALADLLATLDEKFKDGELSPIDFTKLYRKYTKELYLAQKELEAKS